MVTILFALPSLKKIQSYYVVNKIIAVDHVLKPSHKH